MGEHTEDGPIASPGTDPPSSSRPGHTPGSLHAAAPELNHVFEALAHPRRRYALYTLKKDAPLTITELSTKLAAWEANIPLEDVTDTQLEMVYAALYHAHIPRLVEDDFVHLDADGDEEVLEPGDYTGMVLDILDAASDTEDTKQERHARED